MDAFTKILRKHDLYGATEEEIIELENSPDPTIERETKKIFRPIFEDIQRERVEANAFTGELIIRQAKEEDFEGIIRLSRRVNWTTDNTGIRSFSVDDLNYTVNQGEMFVATTDSGYIVGVSSMLVGDLDGKKCGYESTTMVSKLFRRRKVGTRLFNKRINWARNNGLTHINTRHLSEEGFKFLKLIEQKRKDLRFALNKYGTSSILIKSTHSGNAAGVVG